MRSISRLCLALVLGCLALPSWADAQGPSGHAHNDYEHARPLLDALSYGFTSVEADIWLVAGELLVGHDEVDLEPGSTLQRLYLDPLRETVAAHPDAEPITLLIDIKTDGEATYRILSEVLSGYGDILTAMNDGVRIPGAVIAVVSGNRPRAAMAADNPRRTFYDGRLTDLESGVSADFMPLDGNDRYQLGGEATGIDTVIDPTGTDLIWSSISRNLNSFGTIENLTLQGAANVNGIGNALVGNSGNNTLTGNGDNDKLTVDRRGRRTPLAG